MKTYNLQDCLLFEGIDEHYVDSFLSDCTEISLKKNAFLFEKDDVGDEMYILLNGCVEILFNKKETPGPDIKLHITKPGSVIGELCVFGQRTRSASIRAIENSQLLKISGEEFRIRIYAKELDAMLICYNIAKVLSERLTETDLLLLKHCS